MTLGILEWMALIVVLLSIVKIITILIKPKAWLGVVDVVYAIPWITSIIALILGGFVLMKLLETMTIVQIFSVMLFFMLLMAMTYSAYHKETIDFAKKLLKDRRVVKKGWLPIIAWIILLIWVLKELFF